MATYAITSSDPQIATAAISETGNVTITPVAPGITTITVTRTDDDGVAATQTYAYQVDAVPRVPQDSDYSDQMLLTVDIGGPEYEIDLHLCSLDYDYTIDGQTYTGIGRMMGVGPVTATPERDNTGTVEIKLAVDDTIDGLREAINQIGGPPVVVSYYNQRGA